MNSKYVILVTSFLLFQEIVLSDRGYSQGVGSGFVDPFHGSVQYSLPLAPQVTLEYSSSMQPNLMNLENRDMQTSWVGAGWQFGMESIEADLKGTTSMYDDDWFYIDSHGYRRRIVRDDEDSLRIENNPYWQVTLATQLDSSTQLYFVTGITITKDNGTELKFGDFQRGIGTKQANRCVFYWGGHVTDEITNIGAGQIAYHWDLSQIIDPHGTILYDFYYAQEQQSVNMGGGVQKYTRASYLDHIINQRSLQEIYFLRGNRDTSEYQNPSLTQYQIVQYETQFLSGISFYSSTFNGLQYYGGWSLGYQLLTNQTKSKRLLQTVTQVDASGISLPSFRFTYDAQKQYILDSLETPDGGITHIVTQLVPVKHLDQQNSSHGQVVFDPYFTGISDVYFANAGSVIARFDPDDGTGLQIKKWSGQQWAFSGGFTFNQSALTMTAPISFQATDDHVLLEIYTCPSQGSGPNFEKLYLFDWRDDIQKWQLGYADSVFLSNANCTNMIAGMSTSGTHVVIFKNNLSDCTPIPNYAIVQWNSTTRSWTPTYYSETNVEFPSGNLQVSDDMALYDFIDLGLHERLLQWFDNSTTQPCCFQPAKDTSVDLPQSVSPPNYEYSLHPGYLGMWDKTGGQLHAYNFAYDSSHGFQNPVDETLWNSGNPYGNSFCVFTDDRIILCEYLPSNFSAILHTWKRDGANFVPLDTTTVSINWTNTWAVDCKINDDWLFLFDRRIGGPPPASPPDTEAIVQGLKLNMSTGKYVAAGSFSYIYSQIPCDTAFVRSSLTLTNDFVVVQTAVGNFQDGEGDCECDSGNFTDAFKLDRTNPSSWSLSRDRVLLSNQGWDEDPCWYRPPFAVLVGNNFIASIDSIDGNVIAAFFHDYDDNWKDTINTYVVSQVILSDGMGHTIKENYTCDANPTFDPTLTFPGNSFMTRGVSQAGYTTSWFETESSQPRLRGVEDSVKMFKQDGSTVVQSWVPNWSIVEADTNKWYLYRLQKSAETQTLDGVSTAISYSYNPTNGRISNSTEADGIATDLPGLRNHVTTVDFAFQHYNKMNSLNMLSEVYESTDSSVAQGQTSVLLSRTRTEYDSNSCRAVRTLVWDGSRWDTTNVITLRDSAGNVEESHNIDGVSSTTKWGFNRSLPVARIQNAKKSETSTLDFEDGTTGDWVQCGGSSSSVSHTGIGGWYMGPTRDSILKVIYSSSLNPVGKYKLSGWVQTSSTSPNLYCDILYGNGSHAHIQSTAPAGTDKWEYLESTADLSADTNLSQVTIYARNCGAACIWDDLHFYPANAYVGTSAYDPNFLMGSGSIDENNVTSYVTHDNFGRASQQINDDHEVVSEQCNYYSVSGHGGVFTSSDPNFSTNVTYTTTGGYSDFSSSAGWTYRGDSSAFDVPFQGEITTRVGYINAHCSGGGGGGGGTNGLVGGMQTDGTGGGGGGGHCQDTAGFITKPAGAGNVIARVDFYPYQYGGVLGILAFDVEGPPLYKFCVDYFPTLRAFKMCTVFNSGTWNYPYQFHLYAPLNQWYTIEIEKTGDGKCLAWVYPKGGSRNYADMYSCSGYPSNWNCGVWSWSLENYMYLANHYVGGYSQTTTYSDGLGRTIQTQVRDGLNDIVSAVEFDSAGRPFRNWRPYETNTGHAYDPNFQTDARSYYNNFYANIQNPYTELAYDSVPVARVRFTKPSGDTSSQEYVETRYGTGLINGTNYNTVDEVIQPSMSASTRMVSREYFDKLARVIRVADLTENTSGVQTRLDSSQGLYSMTGNVTRIIDPMGLVDTTTYDFLGRPLKARTPDAGTSQFVYSKASRLRFMVDSEGVTASPNNVLYWKYDSLGRVIEKGYLKTNWAAITQALADSASYPPTPPTWRKKYIYDGNGTLQDLKGRLFQVQTNDNDDSTAEVSETFSYNKYGNVLTTTIQEITFSSVPYSTSYQYDHLNRIVQITYPSSARVDTTISNVIYASPNSYLVQAADSMFVGNSVTVQSGASLTLTSGRIISLGPEFHAYSASSFDAKNSVSGMLVTYTYNQQGAISSIGTPADSQYFATYSYNADGALNSETLNHNSSLYSQTTQYRYNDPRGRLTKDSSCIFNETMTYTGGSFDNSGYYDGSIASVQYGYVNNILPKYGMKFRYDSLGRLAIADIDSLRYDSLDLGINSSGGAYPLTYDLDGNLQTVNRHTRSFSYQYISGTNKLRRTSGSSDQYIYDNNGNVKVSIPKAINSMTYDPFTQMPMRAILPSNDTVSFEYNGAKGRVLKNVSQGTVTSTLYLSGLSAHPLDEKTNGGSDRQYVYGPTGLIAVADNGTYYYIFKDHLGSTRGVLNGSTGSTVEAYAYDAWGRVMNSVVSPNVKYKYTGQEHDPETDILNYGARMYDPSIGKFYESDPASSSASPYSYASNDPMIYIDPTGESDILYGERSRSEYDDSDPNGELADGYGEELYDWGSDDSGLLDDGNGDGADLGYGSTEVPYSTEISTQTFTQTSGGGAGEIGMTYTSTSSTITFSGTITTPGFVLQSSSPASSAPTSLPSVDVTPLPSISSPSPFFGLSYSMADATSTGPLNISIQDGGASTAGSNISGGSGNQGIVNYGSYTVSSSSLRQRLSQFSGQMGGAITITGGDRTRKKNKEVHGAKNSLHLIGLAADMAVSGMDNLELARRAFRSALFNTVIYYPDIIAKGAIPPHVHVDMNPKHKHKFEIYSPIIDENGVVAEHDYKSFR